MGATDVYSLQGVEVLVKQAHVARRRGDRAAALAAFQVAMAGDPTRPGLKVEAALELRELGRLDEAEALLRQALTIEPQHITAPVSYTHLTLPTKA